MKAKNTNIRNKIGLCDEKTKYDKQSVINIFPSLMKKKVLIQYLEIFPGFIDLKTRDSFLNCSELLSHWKLLHATDN